MTAVLLALGAAVAYGVGDFLSGSASRTVHFARIALVTQAVMTAVTWAVVWPVGGTMSGSVIGWGLVAGVGASLGTVTLYRGLGSGQMNVVAPLSAATAAIVPAAFGVLTGERPSWLVLAGVVVIVPAIWLISSGERQPGEDRRLKEGAGDGLLAGIAFAVSFIALDRAPADGGLWPAAFTQLSALGVIGLAVGSLLRPGRSERVRSDRATAPERRRAYLAAAAAGVLGACAVAAFLYATGSGILVVTSVLTSLYPAVTVLLARLLLLETASRLQVVGLLLAVVGVVLVVGG